MWCQPSRCFQMVKALSKCRTLSLNRLSVQVLRNQAPSVKKDTGYRELPGKDVRRSLSWCCSLLPSLLLPYPQLLWSSPLPPSSTGWVAIRGKHPTEGADTVSWRSTALPALPHMTAPPGVWAVSAENTLQNWSRETHRVWVIWRLGNPEALRATAQCPCSPWPCPNPLTVDPEASQTLLPQLPWPPQGKGFFISISLCVFTKFHLISVKLFKK